MGYVMHTSRARLLLCFASVLLADQASAQVQSSLLGWTGWARCEVTVRGTGYSDQQTHTWTLGSGTPTVEGAFRVYPATWTVVGSGSLQRSQGSQSLSVRWATNGTSASAPLAVFVRASDGRMFIQARHAQLRAAGAIQGYQQQTIDGKALTPGGVSAEAFEWSFPQIEVPPNSNSASGSTTVPVNGSVGLMQPGGSQATASCTWQFGQGPAAPAPPPVLMGQTPPVPPAPGSAPVPVPTAPPAPTTPPASLPVAGTVPPAQTPPSTTAPAPVVAPQQPVVLAPGSPVNSLPTTFPGGGLTPVPGASGGPAPVTAQTARDPANFSARQTADGTIVLTWDAVAGAGSYLVGGPGTNVGVTVTGTSHTITGVEQGAHTWTVASVYAPGGVLTRSENWSRANATVTNSSGRYRVVIAGFRVFRETFDERINGNGDEVYASAIVAAIDRRNGGVLQTPTVVKSDPYGDVGRNPGYVRAGTFTATGGLKAGDTVPAGSDPRLASGTPSATRFPMTLWEGTLRDGIDVVVIKPVLWEIDGNLDYYNTWASGGQGAREHPQLAAEQAAAVGDRAARGDLTPFRGVVLFNCANPDSLGPDCKPGNDRPIGINQDSCIGNPRGLAWCDITVVVTREAAERALAAAPQLGSDPPNVIKVWLNDSRGVDLVRGGLDGEYNLYLRVERAP
jgi:hypothetical protein